MRKRVINVLLAIGFLLAPHSTLYGQWTQQFGGSSMIGPVAPSIDGGIIAQSYEDGWIRTHFVKYLSNGAVEWSRVYRELHGSYDVGATAVVQTYDLGYALCGGNQVMKIDRLGNVQWAKEIGNSLYHGTDFMIEFNSIRQTVDGGYVLAGVSQDALKSFDALVTKLDHQGNIEWQKAFGGGDLDVFTDIQPTTDGGCLAVGYCTNLVTIGTKVLWAVRLKGDGNILWQNAFAYSASATSVQILEDGGSVILGESGFLLRLDADGNPVWQKSVPATQFRIIDDTLVTVMAGNKLDESGNQVACIYATTLSLDGNVLKKREIVFPPAWSWRGAAIDIWGLSIVENGFGGYYIAANVPIGGNPSRHAYFLDDMCAGQDIEPTAVNDVSSPMEPTHVIPMLREPPRAEIQITASEYEKSLWFTCGGEALGEYSVSPGTLAFGADTSGQRSSPQKITIENTSAEIVDWSIRSNVGWLSFGRTSGQGNATVSVSADPHGLGVGVYRGTILVSSLNAGHTPRTVEVKLEIYAQGFSAHPFGSFDTPVEYSNAAGSVPVTGWALDDIETAAVRIWRDPVPPEGPAQIFIGDAVFVRGARPDVERIYPDWPSKDRAGWGYMLLTNALPNGGNGTFKLYAYASDNDGNTSLLGTKTITGVNSIAVKPFGTIDTPTQGGDASGNPFFNFGWVLTPLPKTVPKDGSTISVYVDSILQGQLNTSPNMYNQYRVDVSTFFPGLNNSAGPVGAFFLDTTKFANGVHTIHWIAYDDQGQGEGIGSRFFNIVNAGGAPEQARSASAFSLANSAPILRVDDLMSLPKASIPIRVKTGFDFKADPRPLLPDAHGSYSVEIPEVNRIEIALFDTDDQGISVITEGRYSGYSLIGDELQPLPIGSHLDSLKGIFSWMPGPGFLGTYDLVFLRKDAVVMRKIPVKVTIKPKY